MINLQDSHSEAMKEVIHQACTLDDDEEDKDIGGCW